MHRFIYLLLASIFLLSGCAGNPKGGIGLASMGHRIKGEYYLQSRKYDAGIAYFTEEVRQVAPSADAQYYLGRLFLANGDAASGLPHLKTAVALAPTTTAHHFWLGVAHGALEQMGEERRQYLETLSLDPAHQQALTYIGHSYLREGQYENALGAYEKALDLNPGNPQALYNRALTLQRMNRTAEEKAAWKAYLSRYLESPLARNAVRHLNEMGDFDYRNHLIGRRSMVFEKVSFAPSTAELQRDSKKSLDQLVASMQERSDLTLHVIVYLKNNAPLAKARAKTIRARLMRGNPGIPPEQIGISWFGLPETIDADKKRYALDESVNFFTAP